MAEGIKDILSDQEKLKQVTKAVFELIDDDKSGFLETKELYDVIKRGVDETDRAIDLPTQSEVQDVLNELDEDGNGKLSLDKFNILIGQVLEKMVAMDQ